MQLHITARHLELTPALSDYVKKRLERVSKHFAEVVRAQVILSVEKHRHIAEMVVHATGHHDFRTQGEAADLYAAVDLVADKLHKHLARQKDRRVRGRRGDKTIRRMTLPTEPIPMEPESPSGPMLSQVRRYTPQELTLSEAASELEREERPFLIFINGDTLAVLYKSGRGTYGLVEPNWP